MSFGEGHESTGSSAEVMLAFCLMFQQCFYPAPRFAVENLDLQLVLGEKRTNFRAEEP